MAVMWPNEARAAGTLGCPPILSLQRSLCSLRDFATKAHACQWMRDKKPMQAEVIQWRDRLPWHKECAA